MTALILQGMHGLGDNVHQRAVIRQLFGDGETDIWLETPWPCIYHDLVGDRLRLISKGSPLRTQAANAVREKSLFTTDPVPGDRRMLKVFYSPTEVRECGSVLGAMLACTTRFAGSLDFRLPIHPAWRESAASLIDRLRPDRPILIYRPLVARNEWGGWAARNPDHDAYAALFGFIRERFFVISLADLVPDVEWIVGKPVQADAVFHKGELDVGTMAALISMSAMTFCAPGFAVPLSQAVGTPVACVFGGYENSKSFSYGARFSQYLGIDPIHSCQCFQHRHYCQKDIDIPAARIKLERFARNAVATIQNSAA
jgi:hypothetical protein